jgi:formylglycine-generating enzyme required for sulfatase activity
MTLVPGGAFIMGKSDDDLADIQDAPTKTVTVRSFIWMRQKSQQ